MSFKLTKIMKTILLKTMCRINITRQTVFGVCWRITALNKSYFSRPSPATAILLLSKSQAISFIDPTGWYSFLTMCSSCVVSHILTLPCSSKKQKFQLQQSQTFYKCTVNSRYSVKVRGDNCLKDTRGGEKEMIGYIQMSLQTDDWSS